MYNKGNKKKQTKLVWFFFSSLASVLILHIFKPQQITQNKNTCLQRAVLSECANDPCTCWLWTWQLSHHFTVYWETSAGCLPCEDKGLHLVFSFPENARQASTSLSFCTSPPTFPILLLPTVENICQKCSYHLLCQKFLPATTFLCVSENEILALALWAVEVWGDVGRWRDGNKKASLK